MVINKCIKLFFIIIFTLLFNCSGFKPLYKENLDSIYKLQNFALITDKKNISEKIKLELKKIFPNKKNSLYILKIEGKSETSGTVSDTTRKVSRYKTEVSAVIKLYYRYKEYDKLIFMFDEKRDTSYSLISNNIRSTLASKKNAQKTSIKLLSDEIYKRILIYLANNNKIKL